MQIAFDKTELKEVSQKDYITEEQRLYFSKKLKEAEEYDEKHKETFSLQEIVSMHKEKYGF